jgi:hypothetical protein
MKLFLLAALGLLLLAAPVKAQSGPVYCNQSAIYDASTNGATQMVAAPGGSAKVLICGYTLFGGGTASVSLVSGTGTNCATGQAAITPAFSMIAQAKVDDPSPNFRGLLAPPATAVCLKTSAGVAVQAIVYYAILF